MTEAKDAISNHPNSIENLEAASLTEREQQFRLVLEALPDGFIILRSIRDAAGTIADFKIEYTNPVAAKGVSRTPEELLGQFLLQLFPDCKTSGIFDRYVAVAETSISTTFETFYKSQNLTGWFRNVVVKLNDGIAVSFSNITDRKQAELALQEREQHFKIALQTAKLGSWEHDLTTGVLTCSAQCKANFGLPPDAEFTHETLFAALHPDDRPLVQAAIQRSIEQRTDYEVEERCYHPDGSLHWLIVRGQLVDDSQGQPIRLVGVTFDITERKQFEQSLQAANQRISNLLESITDAFVACDRDWRYTYVNQEAARMLGRSSQELIGQRWQDVFPEIAQQDTVIGQAFQQAMTERVTVRLEEFLLAAQCWVEMSIFPSSDGIAVSFRDVSERKHAEQRRDAQYAIARILAEASTLTEATPAILQALCENLDWQVGALWGVDPDRSILHYINSWHTPDASVQEFVETYQQTTFAQEIGLPGRVWANRQPLWITRLDQDNHFRRSASAAQVGLQSGFGFPIQLGDDILGVIECFSQHAQAPNADLLQMMTAIGSQIGQFMERKRTEAALRESQELFQNFMNHTPVAAFIKDETGHYLYANPWVERVYQRSQSDLLGKTDFELLPPAIAQQVHTHDMAVLTQGQPMQMLETIHHEDGEHTYMAFKFPFQNAAGKQVLAGVAIDISEQIQVEAALRQREAELRLITDAVPVFISLVDTERRYRFTNQKYERWFRQPTTEVNGKYLWEVLGEAAYELIRPYVDQVLAGQEVTFESKVPLRTGGTRDLVATYVPHFDDQGNVQGYVSLVSDITHRKQAEETLRQSEERLRIAQQAANAGVWDWDIRTNQVTWSEEYYHLYGLDPATTQPSYENWLNSIIEQDRDRTDQAARAALEHQIDLNIEFRILHPNQEERWLTAIGQTFYDHNQQPRRMTGIALDITDRKRVQRELQQTLQTLSTLVQASPLPIVVIEPNMTVQLWNSAAEQLFGWSAAEVLGKPIPIVPVEKRAEFCQIRAAIAKGEVFAGVETYHRKHDHSTVIVSISAAPLYDENQDFNGILLIFQDITERQQAEQALRESEEWARLAIQVGRLGGWRLHLDTNLVEMDKRMREIWGEPEEAGMISLPRTLGRMHPEDRDRVANAVNAAIDPQSSGTYEIEYRIVWNDGTERWVLAKGQAQFEGAGEARRAVDFFGTLLDITDRKQAEAALRQSEERYRYLAESIPQLVWTADAEGRLIDVNQRWSNFTGLTLAQARTEGWAAVVHPDDVPTLNQNWAMAQQNGTDYQAEGRMRRVDGVYRWHLHQAVLLKNEQGQPIKWFGTATDIEDPKQLEQQRIHLLQQAQAAREQAEAANRIKDEFLAVLSHELRSPLNPILGWAKLLQTRQFDPSATKRALETIERNAKLQTQLIDDLLDVSRILRGKLGLNVAPIDLVTVVDEALETVRLSAEAKGIEVRKIVSGKIGLISGDSGRLQQIVWNLLSNAIKFTPPHGQIEIQLQQVGTDVQIQVTDTGKGITPEFLPYVFDYFRQEDGTTTRKFGGLGLGLAIVRYLTELHGGTVQAESCGEGLGATFTVLLPLLKQKNARTIDEAVSSSVESDAPPLANLRILVVDDEADMRELIFTILEPTGAEIKVAASAIEVLNALEGFKPDILISDIGMPETNGYELLRQIRNLPLAKEQIPAIALTAYAGELNQQQALTAGFQKHIAKPVEPEELVKAIVTLVRSR